MYTPPDASAYSDVSPKRRFSWAVGIIAIYFSIRVSIFAFSSEYTPTPADELLTLVLAPLAVLGGLRKNPPIVMTIAFFGIYALIGVLSALASSYGGLPQPAAALYDVLLDAKMIIIYLASCYILYNARDPRRALHVVLCTLIALTLLNSPFVLRDSFLGGGVGLRGQRLLPRMGLHQPQGLMLHHLESLWLTYLGTLAALYFAKLRRTWPTTALAIFLVVVTLLHVSTKETAALVICVLLVFMGKPTSAQTLILGMPSAIAATAALWFFTPIGDLISQQIENYLGEGAQDMVRTVLTKQSVTIANDFFPLGSGAGTYASPPSYQMGYSEIYVRYGLSGLWGASRETANFLVDVFWPKVIAQSGYIGLVAFIALIAAMTSRSIRGFFKSASPEMTLCASIVISTIIISTAATPFTHELLLVFFAFICAFGNVWYGREEAARTAVPSSATNEPSAHLAT